MIVPGSEQVKRAAEAEGLHQIFENAGAEWLAPGCSMCVAINGDKLGPGERAASTAEVKSDQQLSHTWAMKCACTLETKCRSSWT